MINLTYRVMGVKRNLGNTLFALLCSDDNHAIGCTATINGGGSCIFQNLDAFDVVAIQFMHTSLGGYSINDVEGIIVIEGANTTDAHCSTT